MGKKKEKGESACDWSTSETSSYEQLAYTRRRRTNVNTSAQLVTSEDDILAPNIGVVHLQSHHTECTLILVVNRPLPPVANPHYEE